MLTMRFDIDAAHRAAAIEALTTRVLPPLALRKGIAGVHLCLADEAISRIETAEKKARADTTLVPTWIVLIEGIGAAEVRAAGEVLRRDLRAPRRACARCRDLPARIHAAQDAVLGRLTRRSAAAISRRVKPAWPSGSCSRQRSALPASLGR